MGTAVGEGSGTVVADGEALMLGSSATVGAFAVPHPPRMSTAAATASLTVMA